MPGTTMTAEAWASVASTYSTAEERSAWFGAFIASAYIRLQGKVHTLFPGRWSFVDPSGEFNGDDLFQAADGSGLPALFMQGVTSLFARQGSELIDVENAPLYSGDGASTDSPMAQTASMSVIASKLANGGYQFLVASLGPLMTGREDFPIQYSLNLSGFPVDTKGWELKVMYADASTKSMTYGKLETISALSNGVLQIPGCLMTPAVHLIVYQPVESE